jgi:hypothetical protein
MNQGRKKTIEIYECPQCHKEFTNDRYQKSRKFCSVKCHGLSRRGKKREGIVYSHKPYPYWLNWEGKKHTAESKKKMSEAKMGNKRGPMPDETKSKISAANKGKDGLNGKLNPMWNGGTTSEDKKERVKFRNILRDVIFERDDYTCQVCDIKGTRLHVHHKKSWKDYPELRFEKDNCQTLCVPCHYYVTFKKRLNPDMTWGRNLQKVEV